MMRNPLGGYPEPLPLITDHAFAGLCDAFCEKPGGHYLCTHVDARGMCARSRKEHERDRGRM